jgi:predicted Rossmann fold flavoprotein
VATPCIATFGKTKFREAILFTHRGLSGPAVLQISSYWQPGQTVTFNLLPDVDLKSFLLDAKCRHAKQEIQTVLARQLPTRLASGLLDAFAVHGRIGDIADKSLTKLAETLNHWQITPAGSEGYAKAEVTVGGVSTSDLSSQTMAANDVPGLFVIGEAVDVTGWLGGYNFQWAWSSGFAAGSAL